MEKLFHFFVKDNFLAFLSSLKCKQQTRRFTMSREGIKSKANSKCLPLNTNKNVNQKCQNFLPQREWHMSQTQAQFSNCLRNRNNNYHNDVRSTHPCSLNHTHTHTPTRARSFPFHSKSRVTKLMSFWLPLHQL